MLTLKVNACLLLCQPCTQHLFFNYSLYLCAVINHAQCDIVSIQTCLKPHPRYIMVSVAVVACVKPQQLDHMLTYSTSSSSLCINIPGFLHIYDCSYTPSGTLFRRATNGTNNGEAARTITQHDSAAATPSRFRQPTDSCRYCQICRGEQASDPVPVYIACIPALAESAWLLKPSLLCFSLCTSCIHLYTCLCRLVSVATVDSVQSVSWPSVHL